VAIDLGIFTACQYHPRGHSDEARRMADEVNLHYAAIGWDAIGKTVAIRLSDGGSDHVLYDNKRDAVRHQLNEFQCAYIRIQRDTIGVCEAQIMLTFHRQAYDNGFRLADPDSKTGGRDHLLSSRIEVRKRVLQTLRMGR
jgi:hypothetical protein